MTPASPRVLIVDDDKAFRELVTSFLANYGFEVYTAQDTDSALKQMKARTIPVVILDYQLPLIKGNDLIALLQSINPLAKFIIVSGILEEDVEDKFKGLGYFAFFEKGQLELNKLLEFVRSAAA